MQLFISNNSHLGRLSFHIKNFVKALGEKKKSDITVKVEEKLFFFFVKRRLRNYRKLNNSWYPAQSRGGMKTFLNIISWVGH